MTSSVVMHISVTTLLIFLASKFSLFFTFFLPSFSLLLPLLSNRPISSHVPLPFIPKFSLLLIFCTLCLRFGATRSILTKSTPTRSILVKSILTKSTSDEINSHMVNSILFYLIIAIYTNELCNSSKKKKSIVNYGV